MKAARKFTIQRSLYSYISYIHFYIFPSNKLLCVMAKFMDAFKRAEKTHTPFNGIFMQIVLFFAHTRRKVLTYPSASLIHPLLPTVSVNVVYFCNKI